MSTSRSRTRTILAGGAAAIMLLAAGPALASGPPDGRPAGPPSTPPDGRLLDVQLLAVNDLHGHLELPEGSLGQVGGVEAGGAAYLATHLDMLADGHRHSLRVHAGDQIGGSPLLSSLFRHEPTIEVHELMGFDVGSVGNHEFDAGVDELRRIIDGGCHPEDGCFLDTPYEGISPEFFLGANVVDEVTGEPILPPYHVERVQGVPIGFIGLTLQGTGAIVDQAGIQGVEFLDEVDTINRYTAELQGRGVEAIVVLLHEGGRAGGGANDCDGGLQGPAADIVAAIDDAVDVVVSGHTHRAYVCEHEGILVTQANAYGTMVTEINLRIDRRTRDVHEATATNHVVTRDVPEHPAIVDHLAPYLEEAEELANRVVGEITGDLTRSRTAAGESTMGSVIADSMLHVTSGADVGGAELAIHNDGGTRADITYTRADDLPDGTVTYGDVFSVVPFGNSLVTMTLHGEDLLAVLNQQWQPDEQRYRPLHISEGLAFTWRSTGSAVWEGEIVEATLHGEPIEPEREYRVTTNSFLAGGGSFFTAFLAGTDERTGPFDVDALERYFLDESPIEPPAPGRKTLQ